MRHIIRHGKNNPRLEDLKDKQFGIGEDEKKLFVRIDDELLLLNDYSEKPLSQEEIRTFKFTGASSGPQTVESIKLIDDLNLDVYKNGYDISSIELNYTTEEITTMTLRGGEWTVNDGHTVIFNTNSNVNEYLINILNSFVIKLSIYKNNSTRCSIITIESLNYVENEDLVL